MRCKIILKQHKSKSICAKFNPEHCLNTPVNQREENSRTFNGGKS